MTMTDLITSLAIVFIAAGLFLLIANQLSLSPVPFYLLAGFVIGAGELVAQDQLLDLAQWGIAFLVFTFGYRFDFSSVQGVLRDAETAAGTQLIVVGPIAFVVATLFGFGTENAVYFAIAATLSSTMVGSEVLEQEIRNNLVHGRLASSVHFFDDLLAIGLIVILSADQYTTTLVTSQIGFAVLLLLASMLVYRHGFPWLVRLAGDSDELVMMGSISILIAFLAGAELAGLSAVVGAFAAGIAIRSDDVSSLGVRNGIASIRDFFVAIFFVTLGSLVTIPSFDVFVIGATLTALVLFVNPLVMTLAFVFEGYDVRTAFLSSSSLNQVSELSLVIVIEALLLGAISETLFEGIILAAAATMILTSVVRRYEEPVYRSIVERVVAGRQTRKIDDRSDVSEGLTNHIVIVGYGRQGRRLVETCERRDIDYVVIENDPVLWDDMQTECRNYVFGDALSVYPWEKAAVEDASLVVSTIDHSLVSEAVLDIDTDADVILRAGTSAEARELLDDGATYVSVPNVLAGDQLDEIVDAVEADDIDADAIRQQHLEMFETLERYGFASRNERI
ncbi:Kef-type transport system (probable substrate potassium) [Natrialba magadii ATCC 43099]|uniref:Kef-type transport system (Probable substrate potassium) n=1 Tax=Natrialba magadii (strain ATCC 43099 / DSM 3394 / CCM 3739 / CIP 104546 / IAM 13178 / JCM 8861 / NBRC 102185 / NCIMB 2190 / MS3) TaxID=547559 RepID=D3SWJ0_NATMM|nr:cation:proton antiporter [Natrialba magadii]ADD03782.1 Kef-type transport system (probable substrate potassium) [Natrialba magadii ATCC 43099]ELY33837.1 sodium/hydrogen exchanger [Natrialba magadii ATCC 43099]